MPSRRFSSIRNRLNNSGNSSKSFLWGASQSVSTEDLLHGTSMGGRLAELGGRSILLAVRDHLAAALALIELDGIAARIIICPPDTPSESFPALIVKGGVDAIVSDYEFDGPANLLRVTCGSRVSRGQPAPRGQCATEWVLLTSGTSGSPKMIVHTLASLMAPIESGDKTPNPHIVWGTFYDIRRYGGLQIFLRALMGGGSLVLCHAGEPIADHLARLGAHGATHISGTPSHWRRVLMSPEATRIAPKYIRLSGEIVDQAILTNLQSLYPRSSIGHAFASTEAGVAFEVNDGQAGFPAGVLGERGAVEVRLRNDCLQIRSNAAASRFLDAESGALADEEGFVDTGDVVERRGDRYGFLGRRNGVINVGGLKVYPEEVEAVINSHPAVSMSLVRSRRNSFTGALVSADVILKQPADEPQDQGNFESEILEICRRKLPAHKIPVTIRRVSTLAVAGAGKLVRRYA
jgi:acyl-CoA synthetase (AMP-forming)/AMP-acid ligase II